MHAGPPSAMHGAVGLLRASALSGPAPVPPRGRRGHPQPKRPRGHPQRARDGSAWGGSTTGAGPPSAPRWFRISDQALSAKPTSPPSHEGLWDGSLLRLGKGRKKERGFGWASLSHIDEPESPENPSINWWIMDSHHNVAIVFLFHFNLHPSTPFFSTLSLLREAFPPFSDRRINLPPDTDGRSSYRKKGVGEVFST